MTPGPHRLEVEALLAALRDAPPYPRWARMPGTEAEFAASLIAHARELGRPVEPVYDTAGHLTRYRGIRLREAA